MNYSLYMYCLLHMKTLVKAQLIPCRKAQTVSYRLLVAQHFLSAYYN